MRTGQSERTAAKHAADHRGINHIFEHDCGYDNRANYSTNDHTNHHTNHGTDNRANHGTDNRANHKTGDVGNNKSYHQTGPRSGQLVVYYPDYL